MSLSPSRIPPCPPPVDPGSAAVVAHAAESSSGAGNLSPEAEATCDWLENDWDDFADALFGKVGRL